MQINSKSNNIVKYVKSLEIKKNRIKYNTFVAEGVKIVSEMINSRGIYPFEFIVYSKELLEKGSIGKDILEYINSVEDTGKTDNLYEVSSDIFEHISDTKTPQGILAVVKMNKKDITDIVTSKSDLNTSYIILDNIQDSGNLGTIIRTANAFNIKNIICIDGTADIYSPKVIRSTMGAILSTNICYVSKIDIISSMDKLKSLGYIVVGTRLHDAVNIKEIDNISKAIFVIGNEANGLSEELEQLCDKFVKIPMEENQESLNAGVAASIVMYEKYIRG